MTLDVPKIRSVTTAPYCFGKNVVRSQLGARRGDWGGWCRLFRFMRSNLIFIQLEARFQSACFECAKWLLIADNLGSPYAKFLRFPPLSFFSAKNAVPLIIGDG